MKKKWNGRFTICMAQENSYELGLLVSKSLEGVDPRSYKLKNCMPTAFGQRTCLGYFRFSRSSQKVLVFALATHKNPLPSGINEKASALGTIAPKTTNPRFVALPRRFDGEQIHRFVPHANLLANRRFALASGTNPWICSPTHANLLALGTNRRFVRRAKLRFAYRRFAVASGTNPWICSPSHQLCFANCVDRRFFTLSLTKGRRSALRWFEYKSKICSPSSASATPNKSEICTPCPLRKRLRFARRFVRPSKSKICTNASLRNNDASPPLKRLHHSEGLINPNEAMKHVPFLDEKKSVLEIVQQIKDTICKKQLIECSTSVIVSISGGQDSIFLLFCLSFLQSKIDFTFKMLWCNHFWQTDSFYTTLHVTMCAVNFRKILITFLPLFIFDSDLLVFCNTPSPSLPTVYKCKCVGRRPSASLCNPICKPTKCNSMPNKFFWQNHKSTCKAKLMAFGQRTCGFRCNCTPCFSDKGKANHFWCMGHHRRASILARKDNDGISKHLPKMFAKAATSETIARYWRHLTTERSCTFYTLDKAIYGHTLSDRVETIMFNLIRGAGNTGIQSLLWKRKFSTFFYNWFFLSFQHVFHNTHFSTSVTQNPCPCKFKIMVTHQR